MKTLSKLFTIAVILGIAVTSCKKEDIEPQAPNPGNNTASINEEFNKINLFQDSQFEDPSMGEADESTELAILDDGLDESIDYYLSGKRRKHCFIKCLRGTNPDSAQVKAIVGAIKQLNQCRVPLIKKIRVIHYTILKAANQQRIGFIKDYKAGNITKADLVKALKKLRTDTIAKIKNNQARQALIAQIKGCHKTFHSALGSILTTAQKASFAKCMKNC